MLFRQDIQIMRAIAVLLVVVYHADIGLLNAGYLGVDVFFVISGYLMTRIIVSEIDATGRFRFLNFFTRRARRLLPATIVTLIWTTVLALVTLIPQQLDFYFKQAIGVVTFTTNIVLWRETGYFANESETFPLLHFWSLAVEEQFYFVLPAFLLLFFRWRRTAVLLAALGSLALCLALIQFKPTVTFYLLPTRAWEMLAGAICAMSPPLRLTPRGRSAVSLAAIAVIVVLATVGADPYHPRFDALAVVIATAIVIQAQAPWASEAVAMRGLTRIGDWSYSIYLVHWPFLSLLHVAFIGEVPVLLTLAAMVLTLIIAAFQYRFVEMPFRHPRPARGATGVFYLKFLAAPVLVAGIAVALTHGLARDQESGLFEKVEGLDLGCGLQEQFDALPECRTGPDPEIMVWGDSYAAHLIPGLVETGGDIAMVDATRGACGPTPGLSVIESGTWKTPQWGDRCLAYLDSVQEYILRTDSIKVVMWSSPFTYYLRDTSELRLDGVQNAGPDTIVQVLVETAAILRAAGKKVVIVSPPPSTGWNVAECLKRHMASRWVPGDTCDLSTAEFMAARSDLIAFLETMAEAGIPVIRLDDHLCEKDVCRTSIAGIPLYADQGHLSLAGSIALATDMDLVNRIRIEAR
jgi:peptidoglycan/LPS O-acetylase OafA/YrhL